MAAEKPTKLLIIDLEGIKETEYKVIPKSAFLATDFFIDSNEETGQITVLRNGPNIIRMLWELTDTYGYTLVSGSDCKREIQEEVMNFLSTAVENFNIKQRAAGKGQILHKPIFRTVVCEADFPIPPTQIDRLDEKETTFFYCGLHQLSITKGRLRQQLTRHHNVQPNFFGECVVMEYAQSATQQYQEAGFTAYWVNSQNDLVNCLYRTLQICKAASARTVPLPTTTKPPIAIASPATPSTALPVALTGEHKVQAIPFVTLPEARQVAISITTWSNNKDPSAIREQWDGLSAAEQKNILAEADRIIAMQNRRESMSLADPPPAANISVPARHSSAAFIASALTNNTMRAWNSLTSKERVEIFALTAPARKGLGIEKYWQTMTPEERIGLEGYAARLISMSTADRKAEKTRYWDAQANASARMLSVETKLSTKREEDMNYQELKKANPDKAKKICRLLQPDNKIESLGQGVEVLWNTLEPVGRLQILQSIDASAINQPSTKPSM